MSVRGGHKLAAALSRALSAQGVKAIDVGFFPEDRYPDGTPTAQVALTNEFGTPGPRPQGGKVPERPFFRQAIRKARGEVNEMVKGVDTKTLRVDGELANRIGSTVAGAIKRSLADPPGPDLSPETDAGSRDPLTDTATLAKAPKWKVER